MFILLPKIDKNSDQTQIAFLNLRDYFCMFHSLIEQLSSMNCVDDNYRVEHQKILLLEGDILGLKRNPTQGKCLESYKDNTN